MIGFAVEFMICVIARTISLKAHNVALSSMTFVLMQKETAAPETNKAFITLYKTERIRTVIVACLLFFRFEFLSSKSFLFRSQYTVMRDEMITVSTFAVVREGK